MTTRAVVVALAFLSLLSVPATSQTIYSNGPINGNVDSFLLNFGNAVSDTFTVSSPVANITGMSFGAWLFPGDVLESAEVSLTSQEFGGTSYFDQTVNFTVGTCLANDFGFIVCTETGNFNATLSAGTYWVNLQNAVVNSGDPVYWDENAGASNASTTDIGTIPSEAFTILGHTETGTGSTPEADSIVLFGTGVLGLVGVLRRKFSAR